MLILFSLHGIHPIVARSTSDQVFSDIFVMSAWNKADCQYKDIFLTDFTLSRLLLMAWTSRSLRMSMALVMLILLAAVFSVSRLPPSPTSLLQSVLLLVLLFSSSGSFECDHPTSIKLANGQLSEILSKYCPQ